MSIVLTGATGQLGGLVLQHLLKKVPASEIAVAVREPEKAYAMTDLGVEVRHGDYEDAASLKKAFAGAAKVLIVSSPSHDDTVRIRQHATAVEAAKKAGAGHIYYTGFAFAEKSTLPLAHVHLATEHAIRTTGIPYTILRNSLYADLFMNPGLLAAVERGELVSSTGRGRLNTATRRDLALATATVLAEDGHENRAYDLTLPQAWSFDDLAQVLSEVSGRPVTHRAVDSGEIRSVLAQSGMPATVADMMAGIYQTIANGDTSSTSGDLEKLIGSELTTLKQQVEQLFAN